VEKSSYYDVLARDGWTESYRFPDDVQYIATVAVRDNEYFALQFQETLINKQTYVQVGY